MKKTITKAVTTGVILVGGTMVLNAFEPATTAQVALSQLNDTYESNAMWDLYKNAKGYGWLAYIVIPLLVFSKEIKNAFSRKDQV